MANADDDGIGDDCDFCPVDAGAVAGQGCPEVSGNAANGGGDDGGYPVSATSPSSQGSTRWLVALVLIPVLGRRR